MTRQIWGVILGAAVLLSGCATPVPVYPRVIIREAWAEMWQWPDGRQDVVIYLTLVNQGNRIDRLLGGRSDLAPRVSLLRQVDRTWVPVEGGLPVPPETTVTCSPYTGCPVLTNSPVLLRPGDRFFVVLEFERSPEQVVEVVVRAMAPVP